jgi:hypothetical protein
VLGGIDVDVVVAMVVVVVVVGGWVFCWLGSVVASSSTAQVFLFQKAVGIFEDFTTIGKFKFG